MKTNVSLEEAQQLLLEAVQPPEECQIKLSAALGRVLSKNIYAGLNLPPFNKSPLDGYALKAEDTLKAEPSNPVALKVIEEVQAGYMPCQKVASQTAIKVMTGAPIPEGADVVIKFEDVKREGNFIQLYDSLEAESNIIWAGEDVKKGEELAKRGAILNPPLIGLLAAVGIDTVPVYSKPKIAILSTGDELLEPSEELLPGKIYNSNLHSLAAACLQLNTEPISMGIVFDEKQAIIDRILKSLEQADLVITTGGVSVGDFDIIPYALEQIGAEIMFHRIDMKPGSPLIAAKYNNKLIIGLSGNPAAAFVTFDLATVPVIKKLMGYSQTLPYKIPAIMANNYNKPSKQRRFLRAKLYRDKNNNFVKLTGEQSNGILKSLVDCNALLDIPAGSGPLVAGQEVWAVVLVPDFVI